MTIKAGLWFIAHDARSEYGIWKSCSPKLVAGGKQRLGTMTNWMDGYGWKALDGVEDDRRYRTQQRCLEGFIAEMKRRRERAAMEEKK